MADGVVKVVKRDLRVCPVTIGYRAAWGDAGAVGLTPAEYDQVAELGADRYQVDRLAAAMQPAHSAPDVAMMVPKPIAVFREQR